jgi:hypothetical protein
MINILSMNLKTFMLVFAYCIMNKKISAMLIISPYIVSNCDMNFGRTGGGSLLNNHKRIIQQAINQN